MGLVWFILGALFGVSLMLGTIIICYYERKFQKDSNYTHLDVWYRVDHLCVTPGGENYWMQSLHRGKPARFERLVEAFLTLENSSEFERPSNPLIKFPKYRIVRVTEEIVNYEGRTSGRTTGAEGFAGDGGKQGSGEQNFGEVASQGRSV